MTRTMKSFTSSAKYFATIDEETGKMTNCSCPDHAKWCPNRAGGCKHMKDFNREVARAETFNRLMATLDYRSQAQKDARATARISMELAMGW